MLRSFDDTDALYDAQNFNGLDAALQTVGRPLLFAKGTWFQPYHGEVLMVTEGLMLASDSAEGGLAIGHTFRYMPIGLMESYYPGLKLHYRTETPVKAIQLTGSARTEIAE